MLASAPNDAAAEASLDELRFVVKDDKTEVYALCRIPVGGVETSQWHYKSYPVQRPVIDIVRSLFAAADDCPLTWERKNP